MVYQQKYQFMNILDVTMKISHLKMCPTQRTTYQFLYLHTLQCLLYIAVLFEGMSLLDMI